MNSINDCKLLELPKIVDPRGNLSFLESNAHAPFSIKRSYWIYDVPGGEIRGAHSYKTNQEFIVALSGSFDVIINDGFETRTISLNRSYYGLFIPSGIWRYMENFSTNSVAFVVASKLYDEDDYERDLQTFLKSKNESFNI